LPDGDPDRLQDDDEEEVPHLERDHQDPQEVEQVCLAGNKRE
jgi:hypothetical protein